jgi:hypothetical protein
MEGKGRGCRAGPSGRLVRGWAANTWRIDTHSGAISYGRGMGGFFSQIDSHMGWERSGLLRTLSHVT